MFDCHFTNNFMSSISLISPSLSRGTDCKQRTPSSAGTIGRAPDGNAAIALLMTAHGSRPAVFDGEVEFVDCAVVEAIVVSSAAATMSLTSACVIISFVLRSG